MSRYKVYLRSGTVLTLDADTVWANDTGWLQFFESEEGENLRIKAQFAPGMWEGYQYLTTIKTKETEKSGS